MKANRRRALQSAGDLLAERQKRRRLARELAKLNRREEQPKKAWECPPGHRGGKGCLRGRWS